MRIVTDPKLAWAISLDSGVRSQMGVILEDIENGGGVQHTVKGGAGAAHGIQYAPIYARIRRMEVEHPELAAIGHVLCHPCTGQANRWIDEAVELVERKVIASVPSWGDARVWSEKKKGRAHYLVHTALMERQLNLSNAMPAWSPETIGEVMAGRYGMPIVTRDWSRDWMPIWQVIQAAINYYEGEAMEPISEKIGEIVRASRDAA